MDTALTGSVVDSALLARAQIVFTWESDFNGNNFMCHTTAGKKFIVSWGDGKSDTYTGKGETEAWDNGYNATDTALMFVMHTYNYSGTYTVSIVPDDTSCHFAELNVANSAVSLLDVGKAKFLRRLTCGINSLTQLDVNQNTALERLDCHACQLLALDVSRNAELEFLECGGNAFAHLDVSRNAALVSLDCRANQIATLDVTHNAYLTQLECSHNQLSALDVSHNPELRTFSCNNNQLTSLDVSQNPKLSVLSCNGNQLSALDVSQNPNLDFVNCASNQLFAAALDSLFANLPTPPAPDPDNEHYEEPTISIGNNPGAQDCKLSVAIGKGWRFTDYE
ncbi:hypothetical protein FACS189452_00550 [Bacteroidia bacterium]|nr:hypothetical protein FACS189452_00550 [Bacteroidia bacterium]